MKRNLILLVICLLVGAYYFLDVRYEEQQTEKEEKEKQLVTLEKDDIAEVTIEKPEETIKAVKQDERWQLVEPVNASADKNNWDNVVTQYTTGERQRVIQENTTEIEPYGLDAPGFKVTLAKEGGEEATTIMLGNETPTAGKYYAMVEGTSEVLTVLSSMHTAVDKELFDFRDKTILTFANEDVQKIELQHEGMDATFERNGEQWLLSEPVNVRAEEQKVNDLMNAVKNSRIKMFVEEEPASYEPFGLVDPATKIVFWTSEEGSEAGLSSRALLIGATSATEDLYAKREGQKNVFTVNPQDFNNVPTSIEELRLTKITPFRSWEVQRFTIEEPSGIVLSASKDSGSWIMLEPQEGKANFSETSTVVRELTGLEPEKFIDGSKDEYISDYSITAIIETSDASGTIQLSGPKEIDGETFYIGALEDPLEIFAVTESSVSDLLTKAKTVKLDEPEVEDETETETTETGE